MKKTKPKERLSQDGIRIVALLRAVDVIVTGRKFSLQELGELVFGWDKGRVFRAIGSAGRARRIAEDQLRKRAYSPPDPTAPGGA